jgi:Ca2+-binding EF-hand superfamily protein
MLPDTYSPLTTYTYTHDLVQELAAERKRLASMLSKQSDRIDESLGKMSSQHQEKEEESPLPWHGMTMTELQNVSLPRNVYAWRAAHVQAWISLRLDLPQYIQQFHDASIDGIVLLKFVDEDVLKDSLGVTIPLHRHKIMAGIASLRDSYDEYERKRDANKKEAARLAAEEEADRVAALKKTKKKKKKKKLQDKPAATWFGDVREHNDLERVKLERIMREKRAGQKKAKTHHNTRSGVWKFEYTGGPRPVDPAEEVWTDPKASGNNTTTYEKNMKDLFSTDLTSTMPTAESYTGKLRTVPSDSVFDEVLAITRAAMFDVSNRLVEIEMINDQKNMELNSDLDSLGGGGGDESRPEVTNEDIYDEDICDEGGEDMDPPPFDDTFDEEELGDSFPDPATTCPGPSTRSLKQDRSTTDLVDDMIANKQKKYDRTGLVYDAFVSQTNNDAKWLGSNDKLTRLKFYGGFETILRLKCPWPQFDVLWNKLDSVRSGELDKDEFRAFFGDFSEFDASGTQAKNNNNADFGNLAAIMYELCNALRSAGFTVLDIFSSFDRNGSGEVSVSEFCSMLRVVLGKQVDKKQVFRSFSLMDVDSSRSISCNEVLMLVYNVWKSQMRELADRLATLDEEYDSELIHKIIKERNIIKEAVKKNFPREWRDRMERTGNTYTSGPFGNLLDSMHVTTTTTSTPSPGKYQATDTRSLDYPTGQSDYPTHGSSDVVYGHGQHSSKPTPPAAARLSQSAKAGRNEMMRYKINKSRTHVPTRQGASLRVPRTTNLGVNSITTEGSTVQRLHQTEPAGNKVFTLTS